MEIQLKSSWMEAKTGTIQALIWREQCRASNRWII